MRERKTIKSPASAYYNFAVSGSERKRLSSDITVNGNLTLSSTTLDVDVAQIMLSL